ncbi:SGNH/GDSL hydrolase family protein [Janibacter cremeus]|uniref:SGNH/GDSL hydrolase family protein n=1 Tax=Janibacter cremeus TaxID=1285192 RepID=UPI0023F8959D|nr:SGNH/GDSL hydrolase family protein [Janibacter cremeus]WEV77045.1 SGNH/GDSL hydrolase family protein [Janibacter cremeus]
MSGLLVAIGDSFTEGVGDPHLHYPNGLRGWPDRLARQLGRADRTWRYANLGIRSKFLDQVVADQLEPALSMRPTHVTFAAGGNDLLSLRADVDDIIRRYEAALQRLVDADAQVVVFTTFEPQTSLLLEPLVRRVRTLNAAVRDLAATHGAVLVDHTRMREFDQRSLWSPDRIHMSRQGHKRMAAAVADALEVPHTLRLRDLVPGKTTGWRHMARTEATFVRDEVLPLVRRRLRGEYDGDTTRPKWPVPIHPADGMKRLAAEQATLERQRRPRDAALHGT